MLGKDYTTKRHTQLSFSFSFFLLRQVFTMLHRLASAHFVPQADCELEILF